MGWGQQNDLPFTKPKTHTMTIVSETNKIEQVLQYPKKNQPTQLNLAVPPKVLLKSGETLDTRKLLLFFSQALHSNKSETRQNIPQLLSRETYIIVTTSEQLAK